MKLEKKICEHFELCDSSLNPDDEDATFETEDHTLTAGLVTEARKKCIHDFITLHERKEFSLEGWKIETQVYATGEDKEWPIPEDYIPIFKDLGYEDMFQILNFMGGVGLNSKTARLLLFACCALLIIDWNTKKPEQLKACYGLSVAESAFHPWDVYCIFAKGATSQDLLQLREEALKEVTQSSDGM